MRNKLIEFRKSKNLTTEQMAKKIGFSTSYYEKIEYGARNPSYKFITLYKKKFNDADIDQIFFEEKLHI